MFGAGTSVSVTNSSALGNSTLIRVTTNNVAHFPSVIIDGNFVGKNLKASIVESGDTAWGLDAAGRNTLISVSGNADIEMLSVNGAAIRTGRGNTGGRVDIGGTLTIDAAGRGIDARSSGSVVNVAGGASITSTRTSVVAEDGAKVYFAAGPGRAPMFDTLSLVLIDGIPVTVRATGTGSNVFGIQAISRLGSTVVIVNSATADIGTSGLRTHGILSRAEAGDATIEFHDGLVTTGLTDVALSRDARALYADVAKGDGNATVQMSGGRLVTHGDNSSGAISSIQEGRGNATTIVSGGAILTNGVEANGAVANALHGLSAVEMTGGTITTNGLRGEGLFALVNRTGTGDAQVVISGGSVTTHGINAEGAVALVDNDSFLTVLPGSSSVLMSGGTITTHGDGSAGLLAQTDMVGFGIAGAARVTQTGGRIVTSGGAVGAELSAGIIALAATGESVVQQFGGRIETSGASAHGIYAASAYSASVTQGGAGVIDVSGTDASGIRAISDPVLGINQPYFVQVGGRVTGGSGTAAGLSVTGTSGRVLVDDTAIVSARSGIAVLEEPGLLNVQDGRLDLVSYGQLLGDIMASQGDDSVQLGGTSRTVGRILLDDGVRDGSDSLETVGAADVSGVTRFDGGDDVLAADGLVDRLTFTGGARELNGNLIVNFEQVVLSGADLSLNGNLLHVGSGNGDFSNLPLGLVLDGGSRLAVIPGAFTIMGNVTNEGVLSLQNNAANTVLTLDVDPAAPLGESGILNGLGGRLGLDAILTDNTSPIDRLVINGGAAIGSTGFTVQNLGGAGALTTGDGILVVDAINGGTTAVGAFGIADPIMAGAFEYQPFRGGSAAGTEHNWYLRSFDTRPPAPADQVPIFRPAVPAYMLAPELIYRMGLAELGSFHKRRGDESLLGRTGEVAPSPAWGRLYGETSELSMDAILEGTAYNVLPRFVGVIGGFQVGTDLWSHQDGDGSTHQAGAFYSGAVGSGSTYGDVRGQSNIRAGVLSIQTQGAGAYYTYRGAAGLYVDAVGIVSGVAGSSQSVNAVTGQISGTAWTASLELGQKFQLSQTWALQPEAQIIWRNTNLNKTSDRVSDIEFMDVSEFTARLGLRLENELEISDLDLVTHVGLNLWNVSDHPNHAKIGIWSFDGSSGGALLEANAGVSARLNEQVSSFGNLSYTHALDGRTGNSFAFQAGFKVSF